MKSGDTVSELNNKIIITPKPFQSTSVMECPKGSTLLTIVKKMYELSDTPLELRDFKVIVELNGELIPYSKWNEIIPTEHDHVLVHVPVYGGGGNGGKSVLRIVLTIVVMVIATISFQWWAYGFGAGAGAAAGAAGSGAAAAGITGAGTALATGALMSAAIMTAGNMLLNAFIPVDTGLSDAQSVNSSPSYSLSPANNSLNPFGTVPVILGKHRVFPVYGAKPYTELVGNDEYVRMLFIWGYGPLKIGPIMLDDTPLDSYNHYEIETYEGRPDDPPVSLIPYAVNQESVGITLLHGPQGEEPIRYVRYPATGSDELSVEICFPAGLGRYDENNVLNPWHVNVQVEYREAGSSDPWQTVVGEETVITNPSTRLNTINLWGELQNGFREGLNGIWLEKSTYAFDLFYAYNASYENDIDPNIRGEEYLLIGKVDCDASGTLTNLVTITQTLLDGLNISIEDSKTLPIGTDTVLQISSTTIITPKSPFDITRGSSSALRYGIRWKVDGGTDDHPKSYEVCLTRQTYDYTDVQNIMADVVWSYYRGIKTNVNPINFPYPLAVTALRIKATSQLNGVINNLNAMVESYVDVWDTNTDTWDVETPIAIPNYPDYLTSVSYTTGTTVRYKGTGSVYGVYTRNAFESGIRNHNPSSATHWTPVSITASKYLSANPAALMRSVLKHPANARRRTTSQIDDINLGEWYDFCETKGYKFNMIRDYSSSVWDVISNICVAGRAAPDLSDGLWGVITDTEDKPVTQHITPRNSWGFQSEKTLFDHPHGFRVTFKNEDKKYVDDERIVYDDGYDSTNSTLFESINFPGVTDPDLVWKFGRYHIAQARLRPETYSLYQDFEHLVVRRGSKVRVSHDIPLWGSAWGRVKSRITGIDESKTYGVILDEPVTFALTTATYVCRFRQASVDDAGTTGLCLSVNNTACTTTTLTFATPIPNTTAPDVDDLAMFGESTLETADLLVKSIVRADNYTAQLILVDESPEIYSADTGIIPPFDSHITGPQDVFKTVPDAPTILSITSDWSTTSVYGGTVIPRIIVQVTNSGGFPRVTFYKIRYKRTDEDYWTYKTVAAENTTIILSGDIISGKTYQIEVQCISSTGIESAWTVGDNIVAIGDLANPTDVTGFAINISGGSLVLSWNKVTALVVKEYEIRSGSSWDAAATVTVTNALSYRIGPATAGSYTYLIKASDTNGNKSTTAASATIVITVPKTPTLTSTQLGNNVVLAWDDCKTSMPIDHYSVNGLNSGNGLKYTEKINWTGLKTYTVSATDTAGNIGSLGTTTFYINPLTPVTNLVTEGLPFAIKLYLTYGKFDGFDAIEIWSSSTNNRGNAGENVAISGMTCGLSLVDGKAFITNPSVDLTKYIGRKITITDSAGKKIIGYIKAAGTGETYGSELITGWENDSTNIYETLTINENGHDITVANTTAYGKAITNGVAGLSVADGGLYKSAQIISDLIGQGPRLIFTSEYAAGTVYKDYVYDSSIPASVYLTSQAVNLFAAYVNIEASSFSATNSVKQVLTPSATGVTIVSTPGGNIFDWASEESGFERNDASYNVTIDALDKNTTCTMIGETQNSTFTHFGLDLVDSRYYWVRIRDIHGNYGSWYPSSATAGVLGTTSTDPADYLELLNGSITSSQLATELLTPIQDIPNKADITALTSATIALTSVSMRVSDGEAGTWASISEKATVAALDSVTARISQAESDINAGEAGTWASISDKVTIATYNDALYTDTYSRIAAIENNLFVYDTGNAPDWNNSTVYYPGKIVKNPTLDIFYRCIKTQPIGQLLTNTTYWTQITAGLVSMWSLKMNAGGTIAGVGLSIESGVSQFIINADKFAITTLSEIIYTSGTLITGKVYVIKDYVSDDDFSNIATVISGTINTTGCCFKATGTTPSHWVHSSKVVEAIIPFSVGTLNGVSTIGINGNLIVDGTILADSIAANTITSNQINANRFRGINIQGASHITKGTILSASCSAGATSIAVGDTTDFPTSGTGYVIDAYVTDVFTYTGKSVTSGPGNLTGVSGILAHTVSSAAHPVVVPGSTAAISISDVDNRLTIFGTAGELVAIGTTPYPNIDALFRITPKSGEMGIYITGERANNSGASNALLKVLNTYVGAYEPIGIEAYCAGGIGFKGTGGTIGVYGIADTVDGIGVKGISTTNSAIAGAATAGTGVKGYATTGNGVWGLADSGYGGVFYGNSTKGSITLLNASGAVFEYNALPSDHTAGALIMVHKSTWTYPYSLCYADGSTWRHVSDDSAVS